MLAEFFTDYQYFDRERRSQREAGTNDFSLLAALLSVNDEVRLHSRFLYSMLDPRGKHNKGDRFAQHFVAVLGFPGWLNWTRLSVQRETSHIDLYLTDGVRHIIIENKLDALDQPAQIERYVSQIRKKREADGADVLIVYLSKGRMRPSAFSLGQLCIVDNDDGAAFLADEQGVCLARYCGCHYGIEILRWLDLCQQEVQDAPNLANAFREYRHVVELATNTYKSKLVNLESFLVNGDSADRIRIACEISTQMPSIKACWLENFFLVDLEGLLKDLPLVALHAPALQHMQFESKHARTFFGADNSRDNRNKGKFWRLTDGRYQDQLALVVFFGRRMLHIGVLPFVINNEGEFVLSGDAPVLLADPAFTKHEAVQGVLRGLVSWIIPLDSVIGRLAHFKSSDQAAQLRRLLTVLLQA
ncbi:PD-(D/E)XK nuclease family protein|uniref:PDDEXK-like family protein n=1 Tax=Noviherbaspirillum sp. L7-7A TaxID=2850560 RepID=UPI001C2BCE0D|nr:PD-(D/E)XK nuclease family protein [Noviherbaspirillum sp. L7-7A]MBV0880745.1 PD-(D/E)XK nuclease family protein [Noviherbaspirillum sp. L7-7A]